MNHLPSMKRRICHMLKYGTIPQTNKTDINFCGWYQLHPSTSSTIFTFSWRRYPPCWAEPVAHIKVSSISKMESNTHFWFTVHHLYPLGCFGLAFIIDPSAQLCQYPKWNWWALIHKKILGETWLTFKGRNHRRPSTRSGSTLSQIMIDERVKICSQLRFLLLTGCFIQVNLFFLLHNRVGATFNRHLLTRSLHCSLSKDFFGRDWSII